MYFTDCISSSSEIMLFEHTCREWGHLIRDTIKCVIQVYQIAEKETANGPDFQRATLFMLVKHALDMADGVSLLVDHGCGIPAKLPLRSLFETHLGLRYIRMADTENRAKAYQVAHAHEHMRNYRLYDSTTPEGKAYREELKSDPNFPSVPNADTESRRRIAALTTMLKRPDFAAVEAEWIRTKGASKLDPHWYQLFNGPRNIKQLAKTTGNIGSYYLFYSAWSSTVHASDALQNLSKNHAGKAVLRPLRYPVDLQLVTKLTVTYLLAVALELSQEYLPDPVRNAEFAKNYLQSIRSRYLQLISGPDVLKIQ
jgi:hypothetical protein